MQHFIGIVPPEEYVEKIVAFQKRWPGSRLPQLVEPHITVKAQSGLTEDRQWLERVRKIGAEFPGFSLSLGETQWFARAVLYLDVRSMGLYGLHAQLVRAVSPTEEQMIRYSELDRYVPHLTLGQTYWGLSEEELAEMEEGVAEALAPYPSFRVTRFRIYQEITTNRYVPLEDVELGG
ncbi:2'-5' RNA ligase family protein [Paenibacillus sp. CC-CFT747]|nr:2'-5' RNA ligase family protein [Paenibacillus sp. CC-CFT747]